MIFASWNLSLRTALGWLGGIFLLVALLFLAFTGGKMLQQQKYQEGSCTVTEKSLQQDIETHSSSSTHRAGSTRVYSPYFAFTVHAANGQSYAASGYDGWDAYTSDYAGQQAIIDHYQVGQTYLCWYDPANPAQAILARHIQWLFILIPGIFLLLGILFIILALFVLPGHLRTGTYSWGRRVRLFGR